MNASKFHNVGDYLAEFMARLRIEQDDHERSVFQVEVQDKLSPQDAELLR